MGNGYIKTVGYLQNLNSIFGFDNSDQVPAFVQPMITPVVDISPLSHPVNNVIATGGINVTDSFTNSVGTSSFQHPITVNLGCVLNNSIIDRVDFGTGSSGDFSATITQNGQTLATKTITAGSGGTQSITFTTSDYTGGYIQAGSFSITVTGAVQDIYYTTTYTAHAGQIFTIAGSQKNPFSTLTGASTGIVYKTPIASTGLSFYLTSIMITSTKGAGADEIIVQGTSNSATVTLLDINDNNLSQNALVSVAPTPFDPNTNITVSTTSITAKVTIYGFVYNSSSSGLQAVNF